MKTSLANRLTQLTSRLEELDGLLAAPDVTRDLDRYRALSRERAEIAPRVALYRDWQQAEHDLASARSFACTRASPSAMAGGWRWFPRALGTWAASRK